MDSFMAGPDREKILGKLSPGLIVALRAADAIVVRGRRQVGRALDRAELRLYAWQVALDPQTRRWRDSVERKLAGNELKPDLPPEEIQRLVRKEHEKRYQG